MPLMGLYLQQKSQTEATAPASEKPSDLEAN